jgi:hypothetical protein
MQQVLETFDDYEKVPFCKTLSQTPQQLENQILVTDNFLTEFENG